MPAISKNNIYHVRGHDEAISLLTNLKIISSMAYRGGYLVAKYGTPKIRILKYSKTLDGEA